MTKFNSALLVPLLLCSFLVFSSWAAYQAATRVSEVSDQDYYSKGLKYNSTMLEKQAAAVLGWELHSELMDGVLIQHLTNREGEPVRGAKGQLKLQYRGALLIVPLAEADPGVYRAQLPELSGENLIQAEFEHKGARILRRLLLTI
ncbi:FixH family protein [Pelovirga terrestris]|uniref:FixH family protein n=1 Tax=Pelovirga terrestris TaxID=2771352 RepID=A0A8J6QN88_9BACT|nr:FixH family protein [Pelovirga terrestris]MBD1400642.1 FixH family protein [Pelovirga terrestris]